eukprot:359468-Chlamydomonas_euryale.AAC.3
MGFTMLLLLLTSTAAGVLGAGWFRGAFVAPDGRAAWFRRAFVARRFRRLLHAVALRLLCGCHAVALRVPWETQARALSEMALIASGPSHYHTNA